MGNSDCISIGIVVVIIIIIVGTPELAPAAAAAAAATASRRRYVGRMTTDDVAFRHKTNSRSRADDDVRGEKGSITWRAVYSGMCK